MTQAHLLAALPCPFCGDPDVDLFLDHGQGLKYGGVQCAACEAVGPFVRTNYSDDPAADWVEEAVRLWNRRKK